MSLLQRIRMLFTRNEPFNLHWDMKLNELLNTHKFTEVKDCTAKLGAATIWIANKPYADFTCRSPLILASPSFETLKRARARLVQDQLEGVK
jgi:hypothetical protein